MQGTHTKLAQGTTPHQQASTIHLNLPLSDVNHHYQYCQCAINDLETGTHHAFFVTFTSLVSTRKLFLYIDLAKWQ